MSTINQVVQQLQIRRKQTERELARLDLAIRALASLHGGSARGGLVARRKPKFSAAGIARIRAAQKARWAKIKAAQKK